MINVEIINCPFCRENNAEHWAEECGWKTVRCRDCGYLYVNPRPSVQIRNDATELGVHASGDDLDISERRIGKKVDLYRKALQSLYADVWLVNQPITWLDIGAGYGEMVEAVKSLAHPNSRVLGLEPMQPKVTAARALGIEMISGYIDENTPKCRFASAINIFSHIYDFDDFLLKVRCILEDGGELLIETGDMGNVQERDQFPGELGLPDHVAFASERHMTGFLERNGFEIVAVQSLRVDGLLFSAKGLVKKILGRSTVLSLPFSSPYRSIRIRARKHPDVRSDQE